MSQDYDAHEAQDDAFEAATQFVGAASTSGKLTEPQLLRFYGLYKQATAGDCNTDKPAFFDFKGRKKWQAWQSCSGVSSSQAQQQYVDLLTELIPGWAGSSGSGAAGAKRGGAGGPVQSRMAETTEESEGPDAAPVLLQAARVGHAAAVEHNLQEGADVNQRGGEGETALHWAADRGHTEVLSVLLAHGADVNAVDCDGLTALHYAAIAEQQEAAELLARAPGAQLGLRSKDGETAADVAPTSWSFLQKAP